MFIKIKERWKRGFDRLEKASEYIPEGEEILMFLCFVLMIPIILVFFLLYSIPCLIFGWKTKSEKSEIKD